MSALSGSTCTDSTTCQHCLDLLIIPHVMSALSRSTDSTICQHCLGLLAVPHVSIVWIYCTATCQYCLDLLTVLHVSVVWIYWQYLVDEGLLLLVVTLAFLLKLGLELLSDLHLETKRCLSSLAILSSIWSVQLCYLSVINPTINLTHRQHFHRYISVDFYKEL